MGQELLVAIGGLGAVAVAWVMLGGVRIVNSGARHRVPARPGPESACASPAWP